MQNFGAIFRKKVRAAGKRIPTNEACAKPYPVRSNSGQMLDAAHGKSVGANGVIQRIHALLSEYQATCIVRIRAAESR